MIDALWKFQSIITEEVGILLKDILQTPPG